MDYYRGQLRNVVLGKCLNLRVGVVEIISKELQLPFFLHTENMKYFFIILFLYIFMNTMRGATGP